MRELKYKVTVVDDERPALEELVILLFDSEFIGHVDAFSQPHDALQAIPELHPDIVFLDIHMPGISGLQMAEVLNRTMPGVDVVFVTAHPQFTLSALDLGPVDYLLKPVKPERLQQTLERISQRREIFLKYQGKKNT